MSSFENFVYILGNTAEVILQIMAVTSFVKGEKVSAIFFMTFVILLEIQMETLKKKIKERL